MRLAVYVRVSTQRQAQAQTIEQQLERLQAYIQAQGWHLLPEHIFRDDGFSGASLSRPALDRLRAQVRCGTLDQVLLTAPDRLARKFVHQMLLVEEFERLGCPIAFVDRPMSHDPHDQLLLQIRGAVAEYERSLIADRMRQGRQQKYRAGVLLPWPVVPFGYTVDPARPRDPKGVQPDAAAAAVVRELFASYVEEHTSLSSLVRHLRQRGIPSPTGKAYWQPTTVRAILTNPAYTGTVYAQRLRNHPVRERVSALRPIGKTRGTGRLTPRTEWIAVAQIPALVSPEQFDQAAAKLAQNQKFAQRNNKSYAYLLRALISCGVCRRACTGRCGPDYGYYRCLGKWRRVLHSEPPCPARYIPAAAVDDLVWQDLCQVLQEPAIIRQALERAQGGHWLPHQLEVRRENLRCGRRQLEQQQERLTEAYLQAVIPLAEYQRHRQLIEEKQQGLANQEKALEAQAQQRAEVAGLMLSIEAFCQRVGQGLAGASFEQKRQLVELLIDRVVVTNDEVEIRYVIPTQPGSENIRFCHLRTDYLDKCA